MATDDARGTTIASIERAVDVLMLFSNTGASDLGVTEISNSLGLAKAVVHRVLTTLAHKDIVVINPDTRRYSLGPVVFALGNAYMQGVDLRRLAMPRLRELCKATNETVTLSIRHKWTRMYIEQITPPREVKMSVTIGQPFPLHAGSSSQAFLAFMDPQEQDEYLEREMESLTEETITSAKVLRATLRRIAERGYAVSFGERQVGTGSAAAPVFDHEGVPAGVVSVCGPQDRFREEVETVAGLLLETTAELSHQLGYTRNDMTGQ